MSIVGLDEATLTTESVDEGRRYLLDYGLVEAPADGGARVSIRLPYSDQ